MANAPGPEKAAPVIYAGITGCEFRDNNSPLWKGMKRRGFKSNPLFTVNYSKLSDYG